MGRKPTSDIRGSGKIYSRDVLYLVWFTFKGVIELMIYEWMVEHNLK